MKRKIDFILTTILAAIIIPATALASEMQDLLNKAAGDDGAGFKTDASLASTGLATTVGRVANVVLSMLGVLFISYTIYGGFLWMTSAGNEEKVAKGKKTITQGIIGLILILGAWAIYVFIYHNIALAE